MNPLYLITGAAGHLGSTLLRRLSSMAVEVRGLLLPSEKEPVQSSNISYVRGDIQDTDSLEPLFQDAENRETYMIHTAGIIDIGNHVTERLRSVNVGGTARILELCRRHRIKRLVYVSSVHAIAEKDKLSVLTETSHFSPDEVVGAYAKTKAEATQAVLEAASQGLDAVVVHPSGILGPFDRSGNHLVQMVTDYLEGKLPACVHGGYDFVDVRDVAQGCLLAAEKGRSGQCYILSNRHYEIKDVLQMVRQNAGGRRLPVLPTWMAKMAAPAIAWKAKRTRTRPLYTTYSLYTLESNDRFSHNKATRELGYQPRDLMETIRDTILWYRRCRALGGRA